MKKRTIVLLVAALLSLTLVAAMNPGERAGDYLRIPFGAPAELTYPANEPFHTMGWLKSVPAKYTDPILMGLFSVRLEVDGEEVPVDYIEKYPFKYEGELYFDKIYVFNFPEGMEGEHTFKLYYTEICEYWYWFGFVESCEKPLRRVEVLLKEAVVNFE